MKPDDIQTPEAFDQAVINDLLARADAESTALDAKAEALLDAYKIPFVDFSKEPPPVDWIVQDWIQNRTSSSSPAARAEQPVTAT